MSREETENQIALFHWVQCSEGRFPQLKCIYHIPNEGKRTPRQGAELKAMGLRPGIPDICLPVKRNGCGALYIELKAPGGRVSKNQREWLDSLTLLGNAAVVCYGWEAAAKVIENYLQGKIPTQEVYK